jgi:hypothetical protein
MVLVEIKFKFDRIGAEKTGFFKKKRYFFSFILLIKQFQLGVSAFEIGLSNNYKKQI